MLQKIPFPNLSVLPHGDDGIAIRIPNVIRDERELTTEDAVEAEYDRDERTFTLHLPEE